MQYIIRQLRKKMRLSQEEFARELGTTAVTVNRWENGRVEPSSMAQKQLYSLCCSCDCDWSEMIVEGIRQGRAEMLYHGSRTGIVGRIEPVSSTRCDFGSGFYMGTDPIQPLTLVCGEKKPVVYSLELDIDGLKCLNVDAGLEWAMLIAYNRGYMDELTGTEIYEKYAHLMDDYDVVCGYIADDRMYQVLTDFMECMITDRALVESMSALNLGRQYVAISQKACDRIRVIEEHRLSSLELMLLRDKSVNMRNQGIALAESVSTAHRRDGWYFDEILKGDNVR